MPDPQTILAQRFREAMARALGAEHADADPLIRASADPAKFGDYQANFAMSLAKKLGAKPRDVAAKVIEKLDLSGVSDRPPEIAGPGFVNICLSPSFLSAQAGSFAADARLGVPKAEAPRTVVVDYSGPNVAKEMHVGHLRSTVIGDAIARVLEFQGHRVIRQNHLGDWGTQFGMLTQYMADQGLKPGAHVQIGDLNHLYQSAKKKFDEDTQFADRARKRVVALQSGDEATRALWRFLIDESKRHFNDAYHRLGITLTDADIRAESFYNAMLSEVAAELEKSGLATISEGALCVFPPGFIGPEGKPVPVMVRKSDGGFGYDTTDLAALRYRVKDLHADRVIYVVDSRQRQHFNMVFKVAQMAGWAPSEKINLEYVPFGTVLGEDGKPFKTRSGDTVKLVDLLDEAEQRAAKVVADKNPDLNEKQRAEVAHAVGIGAIKYADLVNDRVKDYVFAWDRMLSFDGNTAPYLQNAYVRIRSIFRKAKAQGLPALGSSESGGSDPSRGSGWAFAEATIVIIDPAERSLTLKLLQLPGVIEGVASSLEPHRLCTYLYELASIFHSFYESCPVLGAPDEKTRNSRLALCDLTARTLQQGLDLLGIPVIEQM